MAYEQQFIFDGKKVRVNARTLQLSRQMYKGQGRDGEVYQISEREAVKLYKDPLSVEESKNKLTILCEKSKSFHDSVISPTGFAYLENNGKLDLGGFSMPLVTNGVPLANYIWKTTVAESDEQAFDQTVANLLYDLCDALRAIHRSRVVVGDLKPENILISNGKAYVIDFDSASMPDYPAVYFTDEYLDPRLKSASSLKERSYAFDDESDWFALGVIAFQMFFGIIPWLGVHPNIRNKVERAFNYSVVGFDPSVMVPKNKMRPVEWLNNKPRLRNYFEKLFSENISARYPIDYVLDSYFPKISTKERYTYNVRDITFDPVLEDFTREVVLDIKERSRNRGKSKGNEQDFLNYMLGVVRE